MQVVEEDQESRPVHEQFIGVPLSVVFAEGEAIERAREAGRGTLPLDAPFHISDDDAYFVLPDDIGLEIVDIMRDGDLELLHEAFRDGLLVIGTISKGDEGTELDAETTAAPTVVLGDDVAYAAEVAVGGGAEPLNEINALPHVQCTVVSQLLDDEGLDRVLRRKEYVGRSWSVPLEAEERLAGVDPTYVWSRRQPGRVGIEMALFHEYEELVALLRPVALVAAD